MPRIVHPLSPCIAVVGFGSFLLSACGHSTARLESEMEVVGAMRLEGPIEISMRVDGPSVEYDGVHISETLLDRVVLNETRADWILAVFGEPTGQSRLDDDSEIWKWAYVPVRQKSGSIVTFLSFGEGGKDEPKILTSTTIVRLRDGVVIEKWRD
jgi:hypothetical protein